MAIIAYKFQSPNGSYWYINADDQRTIDYWSDKRKLIALTDDEAVISASGAVVERALLYCQKCGLCRIISTGPCRSRHPATTEGMT